MKIGYARVSTKDQSLDLQKDALEKEGCSMLFSERISGTLKQRPELHKMMGQLSAKYAIGCNGAYLVFINPSIYRGVKPNCRFMHL